MRRPADTVESMFVVGIVAAVTGIVLFHVALSRTVRANERTPIPFGKRPRTSPRGSAVMRGIGAGLIVLGAVLVSGYGWQWVMMIVIAGPAAAVTVLAMHSHRIARAGRSDAVS